MFDEKRMYCASITEYIEVRGHICIIFGAEVPFIVRSKSGRDIDPDKPNLFVGKCYFHGITNSELAGGNDMLLVLQDLLFEYLE